MPQQIDGVEHCLRGVASHERGGWRAGKVNALHGILHRHGCNATIVAFANCGQDLKPTRITARTRIVSPSLRFGH
jgi:hypothetical protein